MHWKAYILTAPSSYSKWYSPMYVCGKPPRSEICIWPWKTSRTYHLQIITPGLHFFFLNYSLTFLHRSYTLLCRSMIVFSLFLPSLFFPLHPVFLPLCLHSLFLQNSNNNNNNNRYRRRRRRHVSFSFSVCFSLPLTMATARRQARRSFHILLCKAAVTDVELLPRPPPTTLNTKLLALLALPSTGNPVHLITRCVDKKQNVFSNVFTISWFSSKRRKKTTISKGYAEEDLQNEELLK